MLACEGTDVEGSWVNGARLCDARPGFGRQWMDAISVMGAQRRRNAACEKESDGPPVSSGYSEYGLA